MFAHIKTSCYSFVPIPWMTVWNVWKRQFAVWTFNRVHLIHNNTIKLVLSYLSFVVIPTITTTKNSNDVRIGWSWSRIKTRWNILSVSTQKNVRRQSFHPLCESILFALTWQNEVHTLQMQPLLIQFGIKHYAKNAIFPKGWNTI